MNRVRVLIVEDELDKREAISAEVARFFGEAVAIDVCDTFAEATRNILQVPYDLIVVDLMLPRRRGDEPIDVSEELVEHLTQSELNRLTTSVAISRFEDVVAQRRDDFVRAGIFLVDYGDGDGRNWRSCLQVCMQRVDFQTMYDFVVMCALSAERAAFEAVEQPGFTYGEHVHVAGLDGRELAIGGLRGICLLQPQMGLVDAAITATMALEAFSPRLICMSGVCAGFKAQGELGQLVVSDYSWEHQAGKWDGDVFEMRHYHEPIDADLRIRLNQLIEEDETLVTLASKRHGIAVPAVGAKLRPSMSGSAVIASGHYAGEIAKQHGKAAAIDMEVFGLYRAVALHGRSAVCFAAKTVVDHADETKDSSLHEAGAVLSARFVVKAISRLLGE